MNSSRRAAIKEMLAEKPFVSLKELESAFPNVSSMTLRRDIEYFEQHGDAIKVRGGARSMKFITTSMEDSFHQRLAENTSGKECVVLGRSNIVGKPQAMLLLHANGTVTICHSKTKDLADITRRADILVAAIGKADFTTGDMIKEGAVVIDVGMNRRPDGKLIGDVDFASVEPKASYITPVPGGVGPMTITMLLKNTLTSAKRHNKL